jgi:hypothetical protein
MTTLSDTIEGIILQQSSRGMDRLRKHLKAGYCERAARLIADNRGTVLIGTGFPVAGSFESDGPIGAIALYQVLTHLNYQPKFVCAPPLSKIMSKGFDTCEIPILSRDKSKKIVRKALKNLDPSLVVSVERPGVTENGRYYNMHGEDISAFTAKFDLFFKYAKCPYIAFGDGGNEIGMGNVREALAAMNIVPSVTPCDELVISTVSNWGVYGVIALMSHQLKKDLLNLIQPEAIAGYLLANGSVDGVTSRRELSEDGFPINVGVAIIRQLRDRIFPEK